MIKDTLISSIFNIAPFYLRYKSILGEQITENSISISIQKKYICCRIYKSANSTVVASLYNAEKGIQIPNSIEIQNIKDNYFTKPSELSIRQVIECRKYYKFAIVRNPYSRFWSCYFDKIENISKPQRKLVEQYLNKPHQSFISPDEFLDFLENGGLNKNGHWARQTDFLIFKSKDYNKIGKLENIQEDFSQILIDIYGSPMPIINVRDHQTKKEVKLIKESFNQRIYKIYQSDFETFHYLK